MYLLQDNIRFYQVLHLLGYLGLKARKAYKLNKPPKELVDVRTAKD